MSLLKAGFERAVGVFGLPADPVTATTGREPPTCDASAGELVSVEAGKADVDRSAAFWSRRE